MPDDFTYQGKSAATQCVNQTNPCTPVANPLSDNTRYFITLLFLTPDYFTLSITPDDFTHQGETAATRCVNQTICPCTLLTFTWQSALLYCFTLSNTRLFYYV